MDHDNVLRLATDTMLARLIQPYSEREICLIREQLDLKRNEQTIRTWNGKHLNDEQVFKMCLEMGIAVEIKNYNFPEFNDAAVFVCKSQLLRPELTNEYKKYLTGKEFNYSYELENRGTTTTPTSKTKVANTIGTRLYMAGGTVIKYGAYAEAVDLIFDSDEEFARQILLGRILVSHENIIELSRIKPEEIKTVAIVAKENNIDHLTFADIRNGMRATYLKEKGEISRKERRNRKMCENVGIRQMPVFDPDSEVNSLCMTIGSWISSIQRVNNTVDFNRITAKARIQLVKELSFLERTVNNIQEALIERKNS